MKVNPTGTLTVLLRDDAARVPSGSLQRLAGPVSSLYKLLRTLTAFGTRSDSLLERGISMKATVRQPGAWLDRIVIEFVDHMQENSLALMLSSAHGAMFLSIWIMLATSEAPPLPAAQHVESLATLGATFAGFGFIFSALSSALPLTLRLAEGLVFGSMLVSFAFLGVAGTCLGRMAVQLFAATVDGSG